MEREDWLHWCVVGSGRIAGSDYLATAAHFAAESSTGTNVNVCTNDVFTKPVDALVDANYGSVGTNWPSSTRQDSESGDESYKAPKSLAFRF